MDSIFSYQITHSIMTKGKKQGVLVVDNQNPLRMLKTNYKEFETHFKNWLVKTSFRDTAVETAITTVAAAFEGGVVGYAMANLCSVVFGPRGPVTKGNSPYPLPLFHFFFFLVPKWPINQ